MTDTILERLPWNEAWPKLKDLRLNSELQVFIVARISALNISQIEDPEQISNILFYALTRGNQLIQQALAWQKPVIGSSSAPNDVQVNIARGELWRYVMAYSGWEMAGRALLWQKGSRRGFNAERLAFLYDDLTDLPPPFTFKAAMPHNLQGWISDSKNLPTFLGHSASTSSFTKWLSGDSEIDSWKVMAELRHLIVHGSLSPTKAIQWNLVNSYRLATNITLILFERLLFKLIDGWQLNEET